MCLEGRSEVRSLSSVGNRERRPPRVVAWPGFVVRSSVCLLPAHPAPVRAAALRPNSHGRKILERRCVTRKSKSDWSGLGKE